MYILSSSEIHSPLFVDAGYAFVLYLGLLVLLMRQMESPSGRTPSGVSRISRWTMIIQAVADGISFIGVCRITLVNSFVNQWTAFNVWNTIFRTPFLSLSTCPWISGMPTTRL